MCVCVCVCVCVRERKREGSATPAVREALQVRTVEYAGHVPLDSEGNMTAF